MKYVKFLCIVLFFLSNTACKEMDEEICLGAYTVTYKVEYINNTNNSVAVYDTYFFGGYPNTTNKGIAQTVLEPNSHGEFLYTWSHYDTYTELRSFFSLLEFDNAEYLLAGWPDWVYQQDNIVQYGIGYGTENFKINFIRDGEVHSYNFGDVENVYGNALLTINSEADIKFEIIGDLSTD